MKLWVYTAILISTVLISGCTGEKAEGKYYCWDGSFAPSREACPQTTTSSTSTSSTSTSTSTASTSTTTTSIPLPSCTDDILNQDEVGIDCGGVCGPCSIECFKDDECGNPHWGRRYCGADDNIYHDWIEYVCLSPNRNNASCRINKSSEMVEDCFNYQPCLEANFCERQLGDQVCNMNARCIDADDHDTWE